MDRSASRLRSVSLETQPGVPPPTIKHAFEAVAPFAPGQLPADGDGWTRPALAQVLWAWYGAAGAAEADRAPVEGDRFVVAKRAIGEVVAVGDAATAIAEDAAEVDGEAAPIGNIGDSLATWQRSERRLLYCPNPEPIDLLRRGAFAAELPPIVTDTELLWTPTNLGAALSELLEQQRAIALVSPHQVEDLPSGARAIVLGAAPSPDELELRRVAFLK